MQWVRGLYNLSEGHSGCVATIGNFDGVHIGHRAILSRLCERARDFALPSAVVLFEPQPREYFSPENAPARLSRLRDKLTEFAALNIDQVLILAFNRRLSQLSAEDFIQQVLARGLAVKHLEVGDDFRFGAKRRGDFALLEQIGKQQGFAVEAAQTVLFEGERVSSSRVRCALAAGDFAQAKALLGRPFAITGRVIEGQKLAATLGTPTANIQLCRRHAPLHGVFVVSVKLNGKNLKGVANIGTRPTVAGDGRAHLEVHLLDFSANLYGKRLAVTFHHKLRDEQRFACLDALKAAIAADIAAAHTYLLQKTPR
ncbi:bifunctional riboflavin kinase/FMN adenylyltransferase [Ventosimonas gracilis]|uniref:Riboflavin biosynthesis protein n=1 Tax=Ventosimonas gracilis TaxID=1680762 RepID=A0A139SWE7_9GAMM|nr:bifunctional riboflavin kinase/FAD synthetase [Ventosimonas gracilis]KXU38929.1 bifunctional riboflavin kinase/FMN adenylyltransferase [Ventosimonas gracilis]